MPKERLDVLDGLRGLAILLVVWYHAWLVSGQAVVLNFIAQAGFLGVDLFFFISGFCLFFPYARAQAGGKPAPTIRHFFERRARKIVPSYVLALVVFAIVYRAQFASPGDAFVQILSHLTFMHTLTPATYGAISGPLWTIGIEVQFYLLFPFIVGAFAKRPLVGYLVLIAVSESYRLALSGLGLSTSFNWINQLPAFFDVFGAGMFGAYALVQLRARRPLSPRRATAVSFAGFALAIVGLLSASVVASGSSSDPAHDWLNSVRVAIGPLCLLLAISTSFASDAWRSIVATPVLAFFSVISYNLYLWNLEIAVQLQRAGVPPVWTFALSIPLSIGFATLVTYFFERPLLTADYGRWTARLQSILPVRRSASEPALDQAA